MIVFVIAVMILSQGYQISRYFLTLGEHILFEYKVKKRMIYQLNNTHKFFPRTVVVVNQRP